MSKLSDKVNILGDRIKLLTDLVSDERQDKHYTRLLEQSWFTDECKGRFEEALRGTKKLYLAALSYAKAAVDGDKNSTIIEDCLEDVDKIGDQYKALLRAVVAIKNGRLRDAVNKEIGCYYTIHPAVKVAQDLLERYTREFLTTVLGGGNENPI